MIVFPAHYRASIGKTGRGRKPFSGMLLQRENLRKVSQQFLCGSFSAVDTVRYPDPLISVSGQGETRMGKDPGRDLPDPIGVTH